MGFSASIQLCAEIERAAQKMVAVKRSQRKLTACSKSEHENFG